MRRFIKKRERPNPEIDTGLLAVSLPKILENYLLPLLAGIYRIFKNFGQMSHYPNFLGNFLKNRQSRLDENFQKLGMELANKFKAISAAGQLLLAKKKIK